MGEFEQMASQHGRLDGGRSLMANAGLDLVQMAGGVLGEMGPIGSVETGRKVE